MRILYAVQATGNGHIARALEIGPALARTAEVDYMISGSQGDLQLPKQAAMSYHGASFVFGRSGGIDLVATLRAASPWQLINDIRTIKLGGYDLIVNDFEPITAWAARRQGVPIVSISHQAAVLSSVAPKPRGYYPIAKSIMQYYAPVSQKIGLHFDTYDASTLTPIIRQEIRAASTSQADYVTVYLPAYHLSSMKEVFNEIKDVRWRIFVKGLTATAHSGHMSFFPVGHPVWLESLANAYAVILGSGFESPSEALFLGKRLLTIPMHNQYEQLCNAAALAEMGVTTARHLSVELIPEIRRWLQDGAIIQMDYPDHTDEIVHRALAIADTILT